MLKKFSFSTVCLDHIFVWPLPLSNLSLPTLCLPPPPHFMPATKAIAKRTIIMVLQWNLYQADPILNGHPLSRGCQLESPIFFFSLWNKLAFSEHLHWVDTGSNIKSFCCTKPAISKHFKLSSDSFKIVQQCHLKLTSRLVRLMHWMTGHFVMNSLWSHTLLDCVTKGLIINYHCAT